MIDRFFISATVLRNIDITLHASFIKQVMRCIFLLCIIFYSIDLSAQTVASFTINKLNGCVPLSSVN
ncbi:MAG: hypothetical protein ABIM97_04470, partial [Ginsengibacter sp.]